MRNSNPAETLTKRFRGGLLVACILTATLASCSSPGQSADTMLHPHDFRLTRRTLKPSERQAIYLELIENFIGYAEHTGRFASSNRLEPGGGYFDAAGSGVTWFRGNGNLCIAYAVLLSECAGRKEFTKHKIPRSILLSHLRKTIRSLCLSNKNCSKHVPESHSWGGPSWQAAFGILATGWAGHLMEPSLDEDTLTLVAEVLAKEADHLDKPIPSAAPGNTAAEDCCWNSPLLAFAANKLSHDPRARKWDELSKRWAINATSGPADSESDRLVDGRPLREWVASTNVFPDMTLENHGFWSVPYQFEYQLLGEAEIAYRAFGSPVPEAFAFRASAMWKNVNGVLSLWDGDTLFPHGLDWSWKDYQHLEYFCRLTTCLNTPAAGAFESRALQMTLKRQLAVGDGSLDAADFGYQTHLAKKWAFAYLMHKYFKTKAVVEFSEAEKGLLGIHIFPHVRTAIHRTPQKLVSISWHPYSQAVFVLPEGDSTFTSPPFFLPYDRTSGCPSVKVMLPESDGRTASSYQEGHPHVENASAVRDGRTMRARYERVWGDAVRQYVTLVSLDNNATFYLTAFLAHKRAHVTVGPLFAMKTEAPPAFAKPVCQYRGTRWLNLSDHLAFISADPLPSNIPSDRFFMTAQRTFQVRQGEWFSPAGLVIYTRQDRATTESLASSVTWRSRPRNGRVELTLIADDGTRTIAADFAEE